MPGSGDQSCGAVDIGLLERRGIERIGQPRHVDDRIARLAQCSQCGGIGQIASNPFDMGARGLGAAGQRAHGLVRLRRLVEHGLADEAGGTGQRDRHRRTM